jgi:hypothetical protein
MAMTKSGRRLAAFGLTFLLFPIADVLGADYSGQYSGDGLQVTVSPAASGYTGTLAKGAAQLPFTASDNGQALAGTFKSGDAQFQFTATFNADELDLATGAKTYHLHREANPVANPLDENATPAAPSPAAQNPAGQNPPGQTPADQSAADSATGAGTGDAPAGYQVTVNVAHGKAFLTTKQAKDAQGALTATVGDLKGFFGAPPKVTGASVDSLEPRHALAQFSATYNGNAVSGFILCRRGLQDGEVLVTVMFKQQGTPQDEANKLQQAMSAGGPPQVPLHKIEFPDGTGSIGIADGYQTNAQTFTKPISITGPSGQMLTLGVVLNVQTWDSPGVKSGMQMQQLQHQMNGTPIQPPTARGLVVQSGTAVQMWQQVLQQLNEKRKRNGAAVTEVENIISQKDVQPQGGSGQASLVVYTAKMTTPEGNEKELKVFARIEFDEMGQGSFRYRVSSVAGPPDTFKQDMPAMMAMVSSQRRNYQVLTNMITEHTREQQNWFAAEQKTVAQQSQTNEEQIADIQKNSNLEDRANAGFDEYIRGTRTIEDTQTGEQTQVPLGNSTEITNALNEESPGRYKEIPLADIVAPLPNGN